MERLIYHIDVNNAFLSWEAIERLKEDANTTDIRTIPSAICGDPEKRHGSGSVPQMRACGECCLFE